MIIYENNKPEGLDLISIETRDLDTSKSQFWLSRNPRHFEKGHLDCREILDSLKNDILTNLDEVYALKSRFVSIFIFFSLETLDLDTLKKNISTL